MSNKLFVYRGKPGFDGTNAANGLSVTDVQDSPVSFPLYKVLSKNALSNVGNIEFDRTGNATGRNRHNTYVVAGDVTVTNFVEDSEDFSQWSIISSRATIIGSTTDPFGGSDATEINLDVATEDEAGYNPVFTTPPDNTMPQFTDQAVSIYAKIISGSAERIDYGIASVTHTWGTLTTSWQRLTSTRINGNSSGDILGLQIQGALNARIAIYAVQMEDSHAPTDYIETTGAKASVTYTNDVERESDLGWLIEGEKQNLISYSGNLEEWTPVNCTIGRYSGLDPFDLPIQFINITWGSIDEITLTGAIVGSITPSNSYTVSFWAFLAAGSLFEMTVSLGGGTAVTMPVVATTGFERITVTCVAGATTAFVITATSLNLTADLNISGVQVETLGLTSYIRTTSAAVTREPDIVTAPYAWNIPTPNKAWSFIFSPANVENSAAQKLVFTNDQSGADEFACYFEDGNFIVKNGSTEVSAPGINYAQIVVTYDETSIRIYNVKTLVTTTAITPSSYIPTGNLYIGMDSSEANALNARIGNLQFFDVALSANEINYLTGV